MRISDWSSDVCSSDLVDAPAHDAAVLDFGGKAFPRAGVAPDEGFDLDPVARAGAEPVERGEADLAVLGQPDGRLAEQAEQAHEIGEGAAAADIIKIGRAACRERVCQYV